METYATSHFYLAVTLMCFDFTLLEVNKADPKRQVFIFQNSEGLKEKVTEFWQKTARVEPLEFSQNLKNLKNRIYDI